MKNWTLTLIMSLGAFSIARAQADTGVPVAPEASEPTVAAAAETSAAQEYSVPTGDVSIDFADITDAAPSVSRDSDTISVDFPDEDVRTIIRNVADMYELNVVIPDTLVGNVSVKLRNVTWRQVFDVVLEPLNFTYIEDQNIIKIKSRDELLAEPVDTRVFVVNFASAAEMKNAISPLIDPAAGGKTQVDTRSNALIITERPSRMNSIQEIIERLDRPTEQVMIESKFIEVNNRDSKNLGIEWASLSGMQVSAGPFRRDYSDERTRDKISSNGRANGASDTSNTSTTSSSSNTRNSTGSRSNSRQSETDNLTGNVLSDRTTLNNSASSIDRFDSSEGTSSSLSSLVNSSVNSAIDNTWGVSSSTLDTAVFSADQFRVVLSALKTNNDVELVSNPTVVTLNNSPAQINIAEEFPIPSYRYNDEQGAFEVSGFEYKAIGVLLNVTPQINSAGFINMNIVPEISSRVDEVSFGGAGGATIPIISTRRTRSTVTVKSGYTLAIGGLIENETSNRTTSVPVLGSIPVLGRLFSSESKSIDSRNLIVFITAKILSASGATYEDVYPTDKLVQMGVISSDVPGFPTPEPEVELLKSVDSRSGEVDTLKKQEQLRKEVEELEAKRVKLLKERMAPANTTIQSTYE